MSRLELPEHLQRQVLHWDDESAAFGPSWQELLARRTSDIAFAIGSPLVAGLLAVILFFSDPADPHRWWQSLAALLSGLSLSFWVLRRKTPWRPVAREVRAVLSFADGSVSGFGGRPFGRFQDLELAIHVGQCHGESMFTVGVPMEAEAPIWYLSLLDDHLMDVLLLGPGRLEEIESVALFLLRRHPFRRIEAYVKWVIEADGTRRLPRGYEIDRRQRQPTEPPGNSSRLMD